MCRGIGGWQDGVCETICRWSCLWGSCHTDRRFALEGLVVNAVCALWRAVMLPSVRAFAGTPFTLHLCRDERTLCRRRRSYWRSLLQGLRGNEHARAACGVHGWCVLLLVRISSGELVADPREDPFEETRKWSGAGTRKRTGLRAQPMEVRPYEV